MKRLQLVSGVIGMVFLSVLFFNCAGLKKDNSEYAFAQNPPFSIEEVYSQKWMAGVEEGGSGIQMYITIKNLEPETLINKIYFRNKIASAEEKRNNNFVGYFTNKQLEIIMDSDVTNEANNTPPQKSPFQLDENEAVLSYIYKGVEYYFKLSNIEEKEVIAYPSSNPNNGN